MKKRTVHIKRFSRGSVAVAAVLTVALVLIVIHGCGDLRELEQATEQYISCENSTESMQRGSDALTEQVRLYVVTGQQKYMDGYFVEANVTRQRETAVEELEKAVSDTQVLEDLRQALQDSKTLMETEYYAMRLTAEGWSVRVDSLPQEVQQVELTAADAALSPEEKIEKARELVFDDQYQDAKRRISANVDRTAADLAKLTKGRQMGASDVFKSLYIGQIGGLILLLACMIVTSVVTYESIVKPIVLFNRKLEQDEPMPAVGAAEVRALAEAYNKMLRDNQKTQMAIRHQAEHDALSGLLNKGAFDQALDDLRGKGTAFALLLGDIDRFKFFNDTYGHAVGDAIIRSVAGHMKTTFRSTDRIFRAGGDEFAVIMEGVSGKNRRMAEERLATLKKRMRTVEDGLPKVTMSLGVVFADELEPEEDIFRCADRALYFVKDHGRDGYCIYEKNMAQRGSAPQE